MVEKIRVQMVVSRVIVLAALVLTASCGAGTQADDGSADGGLVDLQPDQRARPGSLLITVHRADGPDDIELKRPFAGAAVAVDLPGGSRVERSTNAGGMVRVDGIDWDRGTVDVTAFAKGYGACSVVGLTRAYGDLELSLINLAPPRQVEITVKPANLHSQAKMITVSSTTGAGLYQGPLYPGVPLKMKVPWRRPFTLVGRQYSYGALSGKPGEILPIVIHGWTTTGHPGTTADTEVVLDFARPLTPTKVKGTIVRPAVPSPLSTRSIAHFEVLSFRPWQNTSLGVMTSSTLNANTFSYQAEYVQVPSTPRVHTHYTLMASNTAGPASFVASFVLKPGYPKDNARVDDFLDLPLLLKPTSYTKPAPLHSEIRWSAADKQAMPFVWLFRGRDVVWVVQTLAGATSLTIPRLPATAKPAELLGTAALDAKIKLCVDPQWDDFEGCLRSSWGRSFKLLPK